MSYTLKFPLCLLVLLLFTLNTAVAQPRVENFVRVKGMEPTVITAYGIVSGLNGTGDDPKAYTAFANAILRQLSRSGMAGSDAKGISGAKNSALVRVMATIPGSGARSGDMLDCTVYSEGNAKSLAGGILTVTMLATALQQDENAMPLGMASGKVSLELASSPNVGKITNGCRLTADFMNQYIENGIITLVINQEHAYPNMANSIAEAINSHVEFAVLSTPPARVINTRSIAVRVPTTDFADPMNFVEKIMKATLLDTPVPVPRITINERTGAIAIDVDVEVKPTLVTHKNMTIEIAPAPGDPEPEGQRQFVDIDTDMKFRQMNGEAVTNMKLKALQASLDAIKVSQQDMIDIIKILHKQGAIVGDVIFEN